MAWEDNGSGAQLDWSSWIKGLGKQARRVREFLGLSQEQVARVAGVSQGAVSRFEGGRGLATPLLVVMKSCSFRTTIGPSSCGRARRGADGDAGSIAR